MHYVYIIKSKSTDCYYIGQTEDIKARMVQHNLGYYKNAYTANKSDWEMAHLIECNSITQAIKIESHIKRMKSRKYINSVIRFPEISEKLLAKYAD